VGSGTKLLYEAFAQAGLDPGKMPIASLTTAEAEVAEMGPEVAAGHFTAATYFQSVNSEINRDALQRFHARYGHE
ncbi:transporter substrate-binding protein, partial [Escherichia coli]|uniref:transporter substrate-binding protein n=1 Tax=Escherichia coli TaxID=562 RepID=UPI0013D53549